MKLIRLLFAAFLTLGLASLFLILKFTKYERQVKVNFATEQSKHHGPSSHHKTDPVILTKRQKEWMRIESDLQNATKGHRLPDAVGIGVEKCGTTAFMHFLSFHPLVRKPLNHIETHYFDDPLRPLSYYMSLFPEVSNQEVLIEKTPSYFNFPPYNTPHYMKKAMPNVKLILVLCDPVDRVFSDIAHEKVIGIIPKVMDESKFIQRSISELGSFEDEMLEVDDDAVWKRISKVLVYQDPVHIFTTGIYYISLLKWLRFFPRDQFFIIDGEELLTNPGKKIEELQEFVNIPKMILEEDFVRNPETGLYCLQMKWWEEKDRVCLSKHKGRTRGHQTVRDPQATKTLSEFYKPFNEKLFNILGKALSWK